MSTIIRIEHIARYVGQTVTLQGWLQLKTGKGKLQFLRVRDGTGVIQAVVFQDNVSEEDFEAAKRMPLESSLIITGTVKADERAPGIPGGFELDVTGLTGRPGVGRIPHRAQGARRRVPDGQPAPVAALQPPVGDPARPRDHRQGDARLAGRQRLHPGGHAHPHPSAAEGTTTLFKTDFHGEDAFLAQTGQLYNEANIFAVGKTYCFGPTFRAEKSKTRRHLQEFWMVEPEIAFCKLEDLLEIEEQYVSYIVQTTLRERAAELKLLERDTTALEKVIAPFPRISYDEAVEMINAAAAQGVTVPPNDEPLPAIEWGDDFGAPHETFIASQFDRPVFVHHYPTAVKAFYMEPEPGRPEVCRSSDLLAPEGYGEIIGGSERMSDPDVLLAAIDRHGLPREAYDWYVDLRRYGSVPHSGFGLGVERTVSWICGLDHIRETIAFPRMLNRLRP